MYNIFYLTCPTSISTRLVMRGAHGRLNTSHIFLKITVELATFARTHIKFRCEILMRLFDRGVIYIQCAPINQYNLDISYRNIIDKI